MEPIVIDGVIYEDVGNGQLRVVGYADSSQGAPQPMRVGTPSPKAAADLTKTSLDNQVTQATMGAAIQKATADAERAIAEAEKAKIDAATPASASREENAMAQRIANLRALQNQLARVRELYAKGPGATQGLAGISDYLPTEGNRQFDSAAAGLGEIGTAAFKVPGSGTMTEGDAIRFMMANEPRASDYDSAIEEKLRTIENRLNFTLQELGQPIEKRATRNDTSAASQQAGSPPQGPSGPDKSTVWLGDAPQGGGGGFAPYGAEYRTIDNPALKGVNARINGMLKAGASRQQIEAYMQSVGVDPRNPEIMSGLSAIESFRSQNPGYKGGYNVNIDDISVPMSGLEQFRNNAPQTQAGTAAATAFNAGGFGVPQALAPQQYTQLRDQNPVPAFVGDVAGMIGGTSALAKAGTEAAARFAPAALTGGGKVGNALRAVAPDAAYGAIYGGVTEGDPLTGAAYAAVGSGLGQGIAKAGQKAFQGVSSPAVQYLTDRGIPLTIGQTLGNRGIFGRTVNKMESLPVVGDMIARNRMAGLQAFEREALNDAVSPVGAKVATGGTEGLAQAQNAVSSAYDDALSGVSVRGDEQFISEAQSALQRGRGIPTMGDEFGYAVDKRLGPLFEGGQLSGPELQAALQNIRGIKRDFSGRGAMGNFAADAAGEIDNAIGGLVSRQAPAVMPKLNDANRAFSRLAPLEKARMGAINQEAITPAQLARAITSSTQRYGGRAAAARGDNLTDLVKYGQEVLPPTVPNSGTADRAAAMLLPASLGGASYGLSDVSPTAAATLGALAALSTKTGQGLAQKALTKRGAGMKRLGGIFGSRKSQKGLTGLVTAPLLIED